MTKQATEFISGVRFLEGRERFVGLNERSTGLEVGCEVAHSECLFELKLCNGDDFPN